MDILEASKEYIHSILCLESMKEDGFFAVYGLEQQRIRAHENLCELLGILDIENTKDICLNLDKEIGLSFNEFPNEELLEIYAKSLLEKLKCLSKEK